MKRLKINIVETIAQKSTIIKINQNILFFVPLFYHNTALFSCQENGVKYLFRYKYTYKYVKIVDILQNFVQNVFAEIYLYLAQFSFIKGASP